MPLTLTYLGAWPLRAKMSAKMGPRATGASLAAPGVSVSDDGGVADPARCSRSRHLLTESFEMFRQLLFTQ